jgi:hypothetical protein
MATNADVTQVSTEVAQAPSAKNADVTQVSVEVLRPSSDVIAKADVTQVSAEVADNTGLGIVSLDATQVCVEVLLNQRPLVNTTIVPKMLIDTLFHKGPTPWSTYSKFPVVNGVVQGIVTIKEVQFVDPVTGNEALGVLGSFLDGKVYQLFGGAQDGSVEATAITWPLPDLSQLPFEMRDTMKLFRELWVEGKDLPNFEFAWSTDGRPYFLPNTTIVNPAKVWSPARPLQNRNQIGANGRQIEIMFTHVAPSDVTPLLSYMKINYDIEGQAAGSQGAGANY